MIYKTKEDFQLLFEFMLYFYYDLLNTKLNRSNDSSINYIDIINEIANNNEIIDIQKKLNLIEENLNKLDSNMNLKLLMDEFIIKYSEV